MSYEAEEEIWKKSEEKQQLIEQVESLLMSTKRKGIENICEELKRSNFYDSPASTRYHLSEFGGLVKHSLNVYNIFKNIANNLYPELGEDSIVICGLLHDYCKINEYFGTTYKSGKKKGSLKFESNKDEFPMGHGEKSVDMILRHIYLTDKERLIIRWHMGPFDFTFKQYASSLQRVPETLIFFCCDYIASTSETRIDDDE